MKLKLILFWFCILVFPSISFGEILDSTAYQKLVSKGRAELCRIQDTNDEAIRKNSLESMQFIVMLSGNDIDYINSIQTSGHDANNASQGAIKDSLNVKLRQVYIQYGVELYIVFISSLDVIISTPLPENVKSSDFFAKRLYDEQTNMAALRAEQKSLTDAIINSSISGRNRDCVVLTTADFCGAFFNNGAQGCWKMSKVYTYTAPSPTFNNIYALSQDFTSRLIHSNDFVHGSDVYAAFAAVEEYKQSLKYFTLKANLLKTYSSDSITAILDRFQTNLDYEGLSLNERKHILSVYSGYEMSGSWLANGIGEEGRAIKVIHYTPSNQTEALLAVLSMENYLNSNSAYHGEKNNKALIVNLIHRTDDAALSGDNNYTLLMRTLTNLMVTNESVFNNHLPTDNESWHNRQITWADPYAESVPPKIGTIDYEITLNDVGTISVERKIVNRILNVSPVNTADWITDAEFDLEPFDLVIFKNRSDLNMLETAGAGHNSIFVAPAIFLKYASDKEFNSNVRTGIAVALDVIAVATGPGLISEAVQAGDYAIAAFEAFQFIGAAGNLTANAINDPELQELVDNYNMIVGIWGAARIVNSAGKFTVNFFTEAKAGQLRPVQEGIANNFRQSFQQAESKLNQLDEATKTKLLKMEEYLGEAKNVNEFSILLSKQRTRIENLKIQYGNLDFVGFTPVGGKTINDISSSMYNEMFAELGSRGNWSIQSKVEKIVEVLGSGNTIPQKITYSQGAELYKIVKKGNVPSPTSEYWVTKTELDEVMSRGIHFESKSGLPLGSIAEEYDIYKITATKSAITYRSIIAPTIQKGYSTTGGATQIIVLDRNCWSTPIKYNSQSFIPDY